MSRVTESSLEQTTLEWFKSLGWQIAFGPDISPDGTAREREDYDHVVIVGRFRNVLLSKPISGKSRMADTEKWLEKIS